MRTAKWLPLGLAVALAVGGCSTVFGLDELRGPVAEDTFAEDTRVADTTVQDDVADTLVDDVDDSTVDDTQRVDGAPGDVAIDSVAETTVADTRAADTTAVDSTVADTGTPDTGRLDTATLDSGTLDSGTLDSGTPDTGTPDTGTPDTSTPDTSTTDTGTPPSCVGGLSCNGESCCTSPLVTGAAFSRSYDGVTSGYTDPQFMATVSSFRLDKYDVTVGRFRKFVTAVVAGWRPPAGSGKHAHLTGGGLNGGSEQGWDASWNTNLPGDKPTWDGTTALTCSPDYQTWTPGSGANETRPINCINWYQSAAFCIWDGGFLPSEAEWNYAAAGGGDQRKYPWGPTVPGTNANLAIYGCYYNGTGTCAQVASIAPVGSVAAGNGRWGQSDLGGNVWQWTLDGPKTPYNETDCNNCAYLAATSIRVLRGGAFNIGAQFLLSSYRHEYAAAGRLGDVGARCARAP